MLRRLRLPPPDTPRVMRCRAMIRWMLRGATFDDLQPRRAAFTAASLFRQSLLLRGADIYAVTITRYAMPMLRRARYAATVNATRVIRHAARYHAC